MSRLPSRFQPLRGNRKSLALLLPLPSRLKHYQQPNPLKCSRLRPATIREGPSISAKKIGTAIHGAALRVKGREGNWVQFVDPATGNTAWIHSSLVRPNSRNGTTSVAGPPANATSFAPPKSKVAKKRIKQKLSASIQASKQRPSRPDPPAPRQRAYADLPNDEMFLPPRRPGSRAASLNPTP